MAAAAVIVVPAPLAPGRAGYFTTQICLADCQRQWRDRERGNENTFTLFRVLVSPARADSRLLTALLKASLALSCAG